jgi:hypothetical protein
MPNLTIVASSLNKQYDNYQKECKGFSSSESRKQRDNEFETLLNELKEKKLSDEDIEKYLEKTCDFYEKYKSSGGFTSEPTLIKYMRQALYNIFEVDHSVPKPKYGTSFILYNDPTPETDFSVKQLHKAIKIFREHMKQIFSEGISLSKLNG